MPLCKNCGHPHGWYQGLCAACARAAGIPLVPNPVPELEIAGAPEGETGETFIETSGGATEAVAVEPEPEEAQPEQTDEHPPEPPKTPRRRRSKKI